MPFSSYSPLVLVAVVASLALGLFGASGAVVYTVLPDGTGDFPTIQAALNAGCSGDVIGLGDGTSTREGNRDLDYCGRRIGIRSISDDPDARVIDCEGLGRGVIFHSGLDSGTMLRVVEIVNGHALYGGAIFCTSSSPGLRNLILSINAATEKGARSTATSPARSS